MLRLILRFSRITARAAVAAIAWATLSACLSAAWAQAPGAQTGVSKGAAVPVVTATATRRDVPVYLKGIGTVVAYNTTAIRTQVQGELTEVLFTEGQRVQAGDLLARIDPRLYQAQLDQYIANRDRDRAHLANALANLGRYSDLASKGYASLQVSDTQKALVDQLKAAIKADEALIEQARVTLSYTELRSPISGVTGIRLLDIGNIIHPNDVNGLVVVTQIEPISLIFTLPEFSLAEIQRYMAAGPLQVLAYSQDKRQLLSEGALLLVNNEIQQTTGTAQLKATFQNKDHRLWPGLLVDAWLRVNIERDALTIPVAAVQQSATGTYTYVVTGEHTVQSRPVQVGTVIDNVTVVRDGLKPGDVVVTDGQYRLTDGTRVLILEGQAAREANLQSSVEQAVP